MISEQIPAALANERLDRVVALIADCSRSDAAAVLAAGGVLVDHVVATVGKTRLRAGATVVIDESLIPTVPVPVAEANVAITVVHVDDDIIVVDKPAGMVVHPGPGHRSGTLVNGLLARFPEIATVGEAYRPGIVHRLDVGTSGLMLVARTSRAYDALVAALANHEVARVYRALVWGHLANPVGVIDGPIGRAARDPTLMAVVVTGKPARTRYRVLREYSTPVAASDVECRLETGRTHQIRVHLAAIGHPVVGDPTYGGVRTGVDAPRPFLHSTLLEFRHPVDGATMTIASELPEDLAVVASALA